MKIKDEHREQAKELFKFLMENKSPDITWTNPVWVYAISENLAQRDQVMIERACNAIREPLKLKLGEADKVLMVYEEQVKAIRQLGESDE